MRSKLPLISPEHWSKDTSLSENVNVAENTGKDGVTLVAVTACGQPCQTAVLKQHTEHSSLCLRQLHQLTGNLHNNHTTPTTFFCRTLEHILDKTLQNTILILSFLITCFVVAMSVGAWLSVSSSRLWWKAMETNPFRAGQKSWAFVLSPCTSSQVSVTASTQRASSWCTT